MKSWILYSKDVAKFLETATEQPPSEFRMISWNLDGKIKCYLTLC